MYLQPDNFLSLWCNMIPSQQQILTIFGLIIYFPGRNRPFCCRIVALLVAHYFSLLQLRNCTPNHSPPLPSVPTTHTPVNRHCGHLHRFPRRFQHVCTQQAISLISGPNTISIIWTVPATLRNYFCSATPPLLLLLQIATWRFPLLPALKYPSLFDYTASSFSRLSQLVLYCYWSWKLASAKSLIYPLLV